MADKKTADAPPVVAEPEMSLEQAGAAFRALQNAFRGMVVMGAAVQTALDAKHQLAMLERTKAAVVTETERASTDLKSVTAALADRTTDLKNIDARVADAQAALTSLNRDLSSARGEWASAQSANEARHRGLLAEQERELEAAKGRVQAVKAELAAVAGKYVSAGT